MDERLRRSIERRFLIDRKRRFGSKKWLRNRYKLAALMRELCGAEVCPVPGDPFPQKGHAA